jgi:C4-dicarboxylate-specific signal transduction histidine kinase
MFSKPLNHQDVESNQKDPDSRSKLQTDKSEGQTNQLEDLFTPHEELEKSIDNHQQTHLPENLNSLHYKHLITIQKALQFSLDDLSVQQIVEHFLNLCKEILPFRIGNVVLNRKRAWDSVIKTTRSEFEVICREMELDDTLEWIFDKNTYFLITNEEYESLRAISDNPSQYLIYPLTCKNIKIGLCFLKIESSELNFSLNDLQVLKIIANQLSKSIHHHSPISGTNSSSNHLEGVMDKLNQSLKLALVGELAGGITHEINNPLQIILGKIQIAMLTDKDNSFLKFIEEQSLRIATLVRTIYEISCSDMNISNEHVEIEPYLNQTVGLIRRQLEKRGINVRMEISENLPLLNGNIALFKQLILLMLICAKKRLKNGDIFTIKLITPTKNMITLNFYNTGLEYSPLFEKPIDENHLKDSSIFLLDFHLIALLSIIQEIGGKLNFQKNELGGTDIELNICSNLTRDGKNENQ